MSDGIRECPQETGEDEAVSAAEAARDLIENFRSGCCPFCGHDPYHYVDNGVGMERVAVTCCDLGIALYQDGDEQLSRVEGERHQAAHVIEQLLLAREEAGWRPISTHKIVAIKGAYSPHVLCAHFEKKWRRFGRYDLTLKRWYYSGTDERSQWAQVEDDEPTHWMPLPELVESSGRSLADANSKSPIQAREE